MNFISELKRRNVIRMAGLYLVGAWLLTQVAGTVLPMFGAPDWIARSVVILLAIGFVPAMIFAWVFELTPDGLKRDADVVQSESIAPQTAQKMNRLILAMLVLAVVYFGFDKFVLAPKREAALVATTSQAVKAETLATKEAKVSEKSIAVLPFVDMSPEHDQEYFSDGIAEELLNRLAQIPELRVAARTSAFQFKGKNVDIADIGRQLNVAHVLEGSVRKSGTRLRITAQLINSASGFHLWSQTFEGDASDVFKVQDDISTAIAEVLETKLAGRPAAGKDTVAVDPQAYDDYLQGRAFTARRVDGNLKLAVAAFDRAIARAPDYSAAHAGRAFALALSEIWGPWLPTAELVAQGRASAAEALKLDPENVEAMIARGYLAMKHWDVAGARVDFERAYALAPENVDVLNFYGDFQKLVGNLRDAERMKRKAMALDPLSFVHPHDLVQVLFHQGRPRDALAMAERARSLGSPDAPYQILNAHRALKQFDEAERTLAKLCAAKDAQIWRCKLERMSLLAATGHLIEARAIVAELAAANKAPPNVEAYAARAAIYANELKDIPKATSYLRMALQGNSSNFMSPLRWGARGALLPEEISQDTDWLAVWNDPKLRDLMTAYRANIIAFRKGG